MAFDFTRSRVSAHALQQCFQRALKLADVFDVVRTGQIIKSYPDDKPFPSHLILGRINGIPVHVVAAKDDTTDTCILVTAYVPDPALWNEDYTERRPE